MAFWHSGHYLTELRQNWGSPGWFFVYLANEVRPHNLHFELFAPLAPMWSLQIEEQFYLVFPFVIRQARRKVWAVVLAFILGPFVWRTVSSIFDPAHAYLLYSGTFARIDELAAGALAAYLLRDAPQKVVRQASRVLACILVPSVILLYFVFGIDRDSFFNNTVGFSLCACAFASLILWTVYASGTRSTAILRNPTLRYLGKYPTESPAPIATSVAIKIVLHKPLGSPHRTLLDFLVSV